MYIKLVNLENITVNQFLIYAFKQWTLRGLFVNDVFFNAIPNICLIKNEVPSMYYIKLANLENITGNHSPIYAFKQWALRGLFINDVF